MNVKLIKYYHESNEYSDEILNFKGQIIMGKMINNICAFVPRNEIIIDEIMKCYQDGRKTLILSDRRASSDLSQGKVRCV